jgi:hypothetical protein
MRDLQNNIALANSIAPVVGSSDTDGSGVDLQGYESATIVVTTGAEGDTLSASVKIDFKLEDSDDNSTFSAVTASTSVIGTVDGSGVFLTLDDGAESPQVASIGYTGGKRYVRVVADFTGTHTIGTPIAAAVIKGHPRH